MHGAAEMESVNRLFEDQLAILSDAFIMRLDNGQILFWQPASGRFQIMPAVTESGERVSIDDLRELPYVVFRPVAEVMAELISHFPLDEA